MIPQFRRQVEEARPRDAHNLLLRHGLRGADRGPAVLARACERLDSVFAVPTQFAKHGRDEEQGWMYAKGSVACKSLA